MIWDRLLRSAGQYWGAARSPKWSAVRKAFVKSNPYCSACGTTRELEVHHIIPFHIDASRELDTANLLTLCQDCHFYIGHLKDWNRHNPQVRDDALALFRRFSETV
jgi:5-methylcytosine-specific restriction endonuclease McrA